MPIQSLLKNSGGTINSIAVGADERVNTFLKSINHKGNALPNLILNSFSSLL